MADEGGGGSTEVRKEVTRRFIVKFIMKWCGMNDGEENKVCTDTISVE